jgi:hypothetical protein
MSDNRCNCESMKCPVCQGNGCSHSAGKRRAMYVGALCDGCASHMPAEYMVAEEVQVDEHVIQRVANAYSIGASASDIHDMLQQTGMSEYNIYLAYCAGKVLVLSQEDPPKHRCQGFMCDGCDIH